MFDYNQAAPQVTTTGVERRGRVEVRDVTFPSPAGVREVGAYLVTSEGEGPHAGILYVHWYEPEAHNSNRTQYLDEAVGMAERGAVSLLIDTMWSPLDWFRTRDRVEDYDASVRQVVELRRALDVLLAQPTVDPARIAVVGHDFGGMFGAVLAGNDRRARAHVIIAATPRFSDWYLLGTNLSEAEREAYTNWISPLDPSLHIRRASDAAFFFQFGTTDWFVPEARALEFYDAAPPDKRIAWYEAGHEVNTPEARRDRIEWLSEQLGLR